LDHDSLVVVVDALDLKTHIKVIWEGWDVQTITRLIIIAIQVEVE
jgi:hypothetical protein